jgi:SSS family solute:Na+ symporter
LVVRLVLFVMTPTISGVDNTILYVQNTLVTTAFDGWPTFIAFAAALTTYVVVSLLTAPAHLRGLDIQVAKDLDDALDGTAEAVEDELITPVPQPTTAR